jgi:hypothetical protein
VRFDILMVVNIQITVLCNMTQCILGDRYKLHDAISQFSGCQWREIIYLIVAKDQS